MEHSRTESATTALVVLSSKHEPCTDGDGRTSGPRREGVTIYTHGARTLIVGQKEDCEGEGNDELYNK